MLCVAAPVQIFKGLGRSIHHGAARSRYCAARLATYMHAFYKWRPCDRMSLIIASVWSRKTPTPEMRVSIAEQDANEVSEKLGFGLAALAPLAQSNMMDAQRVEDVSDWHSHVGARSCKDHPVSADGVSIVRSSVQQKTEQVPPSCGGATPSLS